MTFGDQTVDVVVDDTGTTISATVPASSASLVDVTVTNTDGQTATLPAAFSYNPAPSLTSLTPIESALAGDIQRQTRDPLGCLPPGRQRVIFSIHLHPAVRVVGSHVNGNNLHGQTPGKRRGGNKYTCLLYTSPSQRD